MESQRTEQIGTMKTEPLGEVDLSNEVRLPPNFTPLTQGPMDNAEVAALMQQIVQTQNDGTVGEAPIRANADETESLTIIEKLTNMLTRFFLRFQRKQ